MLVIVRYCGGLEKRWDRQSSNAHFFKGEIEGSRKKNEFYQCHFLNRIIWGDVCVVRGPEERRVLLNN